MYFVFLLFLMKKFFVLWLSVYIYKNNIFVLFSSQKQKYIYIYRMNEDFRVKNILSNWIRFVLLCPKKTLSQIIKFYILKIKLSNWRFNWKTGKSSFIVTSQAISFLIHPMTMIMMKIQFYHQLFDFGFFSFLLFHR